MARSCGVCVCPHSAQSLQSCPTLCDPMDCSLPGSSVQVILQARILESVALLQRIFPNQVSSVSPALADGFPKPPGKPRSHGSCLLNLLKKHQTVFQSDCTIFYSHKSSMWVLSLDTYLSLQDSLWLLIFVYTFSCLAGHFSEICFLTGCSVRGCSFPQYTQVTWDDSGFS